MKRVMIVLFLWTLGCTTERARPNGEGPVGTDVGERTGTTDETALPTDSGVVSGLDLLASRPPLDRRFFCVEPVALPLDGWFSAAENLGVGTVGVNEVRWDLMEPEPPEAGVPHYDPAAWALLDSIAARAAAVDLRLQLVVQVRSSWGTASTENGVGASGSSPVLPEAEAAYERWLGDLLTAYGDADQGLIVMVGNELEAPGHWNGSAEVPADAEAYSALMARTAAVRDAVAPDVELWRGSTNFGFMFDDGPDDATVDERLQAAVGTTTGHSLLEEALAGEVPFDAFSLHPNYGESALLHQVRWVRDQLTSPAPLVAEDMRSVPVDGLVRRWPDEDGDGEADIIAEVGAGDADAIRTWRAAQVETLSQKVVLAASAGLSVACVSTLQDFPSSYPLATWHHTGLIDDDGTPRPAYVAYQLWIAALLGWTPHEPLLEGDMWVVPFQRGDELAVVAWGVGTWGPPPTWGEVAVALRPPVQDGVEGWQEVELDGGGVPLTAVPAWVVFEASRS